MTSLHMLEAHWSEKMDLFQGQVKVINYRLVEEVLQTFKEELFLSYCQFYSKKCDNSF